jgi:putative phosphoribosyl transferase
MMFRDRRDAGVKLASELRSTPPAVVVGLPRGGVIVADEVAKALDMPLDIALVRKLGAPGEPELGIGAIAENGVEVLNIGLIDMLGISPAALDREREHQRHELERRSRLYRSGRKPLEVTNRRAILIDDGLATGATATAAARSLRARGASALILAVPVGAPTAVRDLSEEVDEVVCLEQPVLFRAVGQWYEDFRQTTDAEVLECLTK